ncbi:hypothetical protein P9D36_18400 [Bacillus haynesii]|uniref:hypothetical protein n=1 Tax=Bacillus haynesii TaxID=1925021 RepID=UPI0015943A7B|nr:hypothetical protein [Bacillus haynesii]NVB35468.1 hypothetical protein [Bacillus licheniformis]MCY7777977.1 hypothetical protein [Bacillus haynesii]MCY7817838.1 hypothetical protein [Bacillus haynesii]MCY8372622.1 hypothetical protein [Bacillus haynesii]MCY8569056.1 hypothetical protein [Bacillus haynesii]
MRLNLYAVVFIMLAALSNVVLLYVFDQGVLAYTSAVIFLFAAAFCTKRRTEE